MEQQLKMTEFNQEHFFDLIKKTYEKGMNEKEITVEKVMADLKEDLKKSLLK